MTDGTPGLSVIDDMAAKLQSGAGGSGSSALDVGSLLGSVSVTSICISIVAGLVGSAYFIYGKKNGDMKMLCSGVALCVVPYFVGNSILLMVACVAMAAVPFVL
jgi:hypothetical protein